MLRTLPEELRVLKPEEFVQLEELGQLEEFALVALRRLAVRALKKNLVVRALLRNLEVYGPAAIKEAFLHSLLA